MAAPKLTCKYPAYAEFVCSAIRCVDAADCRSLSAAVRQFNATYRGDPFFSQPSRRLPGGNVAAGREVEYSTNDTVDARDASERALFVISLQLDRAVHESTGVDGVVRRIEDAATFQLSA